MPQDSLIVFPSSTGPVVVSGLARPPVVRAPRIRVRIGKAGYVGEVEEYDPKYPNVRYVAQDDVPVATADEEPVNEAPKPKPKAKRAKRTTTDKRKKAKAEDKGK